MSKSRDTHKETKKAPKMTLAEKRRAKREKKQQKANAGTTTL